MNGKFTFIDPNSVNDIDEILPEIIASLLIRTIERDKRLKEFVDKTA